MATTNKGHTATETFGTTSPVTGSAPTAVDGTDGQPIQDLDSVTLAVVCPSGQTFSGAGSFDAYLLDREVNLWGRAAHLDFTPASGSRTQYFEASLAACPRGAFLKWIPNGVTFSGGTSGVDVYQLGYSRLSRGLYRKPGE